jgi:hypothetical protein
MKFVNSLFKWVKGAVKEMDQYSKEISFTYKRKNTYKTHIGGIITAFMRSPLYVVGFHTTLL